MTASATLNRSGASRLAERNLASIQDLLIGEQDRREDYTARARAVRRLQEGLRRLGLVAGLSVFVLPLLLAALITLDLPLGWFDGWVHNDALRASQWVSRGEALLAASIFLLILLTRRYGALVVTRVQGLSWILAVGLSAVMLVYLAPQLTEADMPPMRYVLGVIVAWFTGQQVAIQVYDTVRGSAWWRAPFYGALFGFGVEVALFFPIAYGGADVPWASWMFLDFCLKVLAAAAFLVLYRLLRRRIRPRGGLGGA